ncbi:phosphoesterase, partial [Halorubrum sp. CGM5_25_10-8B]
IADSALQSLETGELEYMARQLAEIIEEGGDGMAILTHDNPEPDSIASATALQAIAEAFGVDADIVYSGDVGHQENRAFVNLLGIDLLARDEAPELSEYGTVAAVDLAKSAEEGFDFDVGIDIYIDHLESEVPFDARFVDVRTNVSSTSTILTKYL